jgi:hypothetical protein
MLHFMIKIAVVLATHVLQGRNMQIAEVVALHVRFADNPVETVELLTTEVRWLRPCINIAPALRFILPDCLTML